MCICWVASEAAPLPGPLPGKLCSLGVLREEAATDPLLWLAHAPSVSRRGLVAVLCLEGPPP